MRLLTLVLFVSVASFGFSQETLSTSEAVMDSIYQKNIKKSRINGVYIPKDLTDAFEELNRLSSKKSILKYKMEEEDIVVQKLYFGLGRWIAYNWNFAEGSRFSHHLKSQEVFRYDDMIDFVMRTYHRFLNQKDLGIEELVAGYKEKWELDKKKKEEKGTVLETKTRPIKKN